MSYLIFFPCGITFYFLYRLWRNYFSIPEGKGLVFKRLRKLVLAAGTLATLAFTLNFLGNPAVLGGPALLILVAGWAASDHLTRKGGNPLAFFRRDSLVLGMRSAGFVARLIKATQAPTFLKFGPVSLPTSAEVEHFLIAGISPKAKAAALGGILAQLRARGDTAIVLDAGGAILAKNFNADSDFIFNPFDARSVAWSPVAELKGSVSAAALARSIIPGRPGVDRLLEVQAQSLVAAVLEATQSGPHPLRDFLYYTQFAPRHELQKLVEDSPAASCLRSAEVFDPVRKLISSFVSSFDTLPTNGLSFSLVEMIEAEHSGVLFVTATEVPAASLQPLVGSLVSLAALHVTAMAPSETRRIWLILDDVHTFGQIEGLATFTERAGIAGGCLVLGVSALEPFLAAYGASAAQKILESLGTKILLRCPDSLTADYVSRPLPLKSQLLIKKVAALDASALAAHLQQLGDFSAVLRTGNGETPACEIALGPIERGAKPANKAVAFEPRDFSRHPVLQVNAKVSPTYQPPKQALEQVARVLPVPNALSTRSPRKVAMELPVEARIAVPAVLPDPKKVLKPVALVSPRGPSSVSAADPILVARGVEIEARAEPVAKGGDPTRRVGAADVGALSLPDGEVAGLQELAAEDSKQPLLEPRLAGREPGTESGHAKTQNQPRPEDAQTASARPPRVAQPQQASNGRVNLPRPQIVEGRAPASAHIPVHNKPKNQTPAKSKTATSARPSMRDLLN